MVNTDEKYMKEAIKQAKKAYAIGEVPIGCVIVYEDNVPEFNHQVEFTTGVLGEECSQMMKAFFKELREKKKKTIRHTAE